MESESQTTNAREGSSPSNPACVVSKLSGVTGSKGGLALLRPHVPGPACLLFLLLYFLGLQSTRHLFDENPF